MATVTEKYQSAVNAQDLTSKADREGPIDAIVSVAWNRSRIGAALMRLGGGQVKELEMVHRHLLAWAIAADRTEAIAPELLVIDILRWWLSQRCPACKGSKWVLMPGQPKRPCNHCHSSSERPIPHGQDGRAMLAYMDQCIHRVRASIKGRMGR